MAPLAPALSCWDTASSGIPPSFGATIGTFNARIRPGWADRQRVQGSRMNALPWTDSQLSPGR
ncbi:hypothetical protein ACFOY2_23145 [Nonomuraea purpurea]|uniref:Uncharacterized protein n=1 Tax=Nonomuraea purpurea TaxID=1849276 RepID=A0ABV8G821_9ACTN